jgi:hypothetical protein
MIVAVSGVAVFFYEFPDEREIKFTPMEIQSRAVSAVRGFAISTEMAIRSTMIDLHPKETRSNTWTESHFCYFEWPCKDRARLRQNKAMSSELNIVFASVGFALFAYREWHYEETAI